LEEAAINCYGEKTDINGNSLNTVTGEVIQYFHEAVMNFLHQTYAKFTV